MYEIFASGVSASGSIEGVSGSLYTVLKSIQLDVPLNLLASGLVNPTVIVSGVGNDSVYTFHSSVSLDLAFRSNQDVYAWATTDFEDSNFIIHYIQVGNPQEMLIGGINNNIPSSGWVHPVHSGSYTDLWFWG